MIFRQLFEPETSTYTYLLADEKTRDAVLIDPVLETVERDLTLIRELGLELRYALDTHVHADHITGTGTLRERTGCKTVLSERAGSAYADVLVKQDDLLDFGSFTIEVRETPGHTNGCITFVSREPDGRTRAFTGDALLIRGCGRTDFQQGNARELYRSVHEQIFTLPPETEIYPGHDYKGRTMSTVAEEIAHNPRLGSNRDVESFVEIMAGLGLAYPKKIDVALPANLFCGVPAGLRVDGASPDEKRARDDGWAPIQLTAAGVPEVEPAWVAANGGAALIVDVREADELTGPLGHIAGVKHAPLANVQRELDREDRARPVVLVCRSGGRSARAVLALRELGFTHLASMRGGMTAWNAQGLAAVH